jgi:nitrilase
MKSSPRFAAHETQCRVALVQHPPVYLNLPASLDRAGELTCQAAAEGAALVVFPETWLPGYPIWLDSAPGAALWNHPPAKALYQLLAENAVTLPGPAVERLREMARRSGAFLVMGAHERRGGTLYNAMLFVAPDGRLRVHRKLTPTYTERLVWGVGDGSTLDVLDTPWGLLGGLICWEHWLPLARAAMHAMHESIHVAQWPTARDLHQIASRHYAFEGQCWVLAAGTFLRRGDVLAGFRSLAGAPREAGELLASIPGDDDEVLQSGGSVVIAPDASLIGEPLFNRSGIVMADLDLTRRTTGNLLLDTDGHYARPDVFQLRVNTRPQVNVQFEDGGNSDPPPELQPPGSDPLD